MARRAPRGKGKFVVSKSATEMVVRFFGGVHKTFLFHPKRHYWYQLAYRKEPIILKRTQSVLPPIDHAHTRSSSWGGTGQTSRERYTRVSEVKTNQVKEIPYHVVIDSSTLFVRHVSV